MEFGYKQIAGTEVDGTHVVPAEVVGGAQAYNDIMDPAFDAHRDDIVETLLEHDYEQDIESALDTIFLQPEALELTDLRVHWAELSTEREYILCGEADSSSAMYLLGRNVDVLGDRHSTEELVEQLKIEMRRAVEELKQDIQQGRSGLFVVLDEQDSEQMLGSPYETGDSCKEEILSRLEDMYRWKIAHSYTEALIKFENDASEYGLRSAGSMNSGAKYVFDYWLALDLERRGFLAPKAVENMTKYGLLVPPEITNEEEGSNE